MSSEISKKPSTKQNSSVTTKNVMKALKPVLIDYMILGIGISLIVTIVSITCYFTLVYPNPTYLNGLYFNNKVSGYDATNLDYYEAYTDNTSYFFGECMADPITANIQLVKIGRLVSCTFNPNPLTVPPGSEASTIQLYTAQAGTLVIPTRFCPTQEVGFVFTAYAGDQVVTANLVVMTNGAVEAFNSNYSSFPNTSNIGW